VRISKTASNTNEQHAYGSGP